MNKFLVLILCIFFLSFASATFSCDDFATKWEHCTRMNFTGVQCDSYWANASDCSFKNSYFNESNFYNSSEIDSIIDNLEDDFKDEVKNYSINITNETFITKEEYKNFSLGLRDSVLFLNSSSQSLEKRISDLERGNNNSSSSDDVVFILIIVVIVCLVVIVVLVVVNNNKNYSPRQYPAEKNFGRHEFADDDPEEDKKPKKRK